METGAAFQDLSLTVSRAEPTLETLPAELRILILNNVPDLKSLHNLVHASSAYHQVYVRAREEILRGVVLREYAEDQVDVAEAIVAVRSRGVDSALESNREEIMTLLDYRRRPQEIRRLIFFKGGSPVEPATVDECVDLLALRRKFNFLVRDYCLTASRPPWVSEDKWNDVISSLVLSDIEKARLLRAFYRLQTYCNIFGAPEYPLFPTLWLDCTYTRNGMWALFFATMPPWEVEEISCAATYVHEKFAMLLTEIVLEIHSPGTTYIEPSPGDLAYTLTELKVELMTYDSHVAHMSAVGPSFLYKSLNRPYEERRSFLEHNLGGCHTSFLEVVQYWMDPWISISPADRFDRHPGNVEEYLCSLPVLEQPNLAWRRFWFSDSPITNVLVELMFDVSPVFGNREAWEWGYTIWDAERLEEWGIENMRTVEQRYM